MGENLQQRTILTDNTVNGKNLIPGGCLPLSRGYIHVYNHYYQTSSSLKRLANQCQISCGASLGSGKESTAHMTKIAVMLIYGKNLQKFFSYRTNSPMNMKLCMEQYVLKLYIVYINDDPELTLTHFKTMSYLAKLVFVLTVGPYIR